jgi:hypothetical protein
MHLPHHLSVGFKFEAAMIHCDNLLAIPHQAGGGRGYGAMLKSSANRAVVVLAMASWQALVQDTVTFILDYRELESVRAKAVRELGRFSTPSAANTRKLLRLVGFDPDPYWSWRGTDGQQVEGRLKDWLNVRHAIAHGDEMMPKVLVLEEVREKGPRLAVRGPNIRVEDARQCAAFIRRLAWATLNGVAWEM